jgi:hypothetical protein
LISLGTTITINVVIISCNVQRLLFIGEDRLLTDVVGVVIGRVDEFAAV